MNCEEFWWSRIMQEVSLVEEGVISKQVAMGWISSYIDSCFDDKRDTGKSTSIDKINE